MCVLGDAPDTTRRMRGQNGTTTLVRLFWLRVAIVTSSIVVGWGVGILQGLIDAHDVLVLLSSKHPQLKEEFPRDTCTRQLHWFKRFLTALQAGHVQSRSTQVFVARREAKRRPTWTSDAVSIARNRWCTTTMNLLDWCVFRTHSAMLSVKVLR